MDKYEKARIDCSIVVPLYNEELAVSELYRRLTDTMKKTGLTYEIIFVDDGSTDKTLDLTKDIAEKDAEVTLVELRRNFGQTPALINSVSKILARVMAGGIPAKWVIKSGMRTPKPIPIGSG